MKNTIFKGVGTALVTPFTETGAVDYEAFEKLLDYQLAGGVDAFIVCATTGEAPTLEDDEHIEAIKFVVDFTKGRIPVIAGTGSNNTDHAVMMSKRAEKVGADALLCVTPYYNKCTQGGLVASYTKIADSTGLPMLVYNVPSRTGVNIKPDTYQKLGEHPRIVGIKEANGDISSVVETMSKCSDTLDLYSGNDDQIIPLMCMGGVGVISVLSNILPKETKEMTTKFFEGDVKGAAQMQMHYKALIDALFCEVNPIPAKAALSAMGIIKNCVRLPLTPMERANYEKLVALMRKEGLAV